jgi:hypothetical protein
MKRLGTRALTFWPSCVREAELSEQHASVGMYKESGPGAELGSLFQEDWRSYDQKRDCLRCGTQSASGFTKAPYL